MKCVLSKIENVKIGDNNPKGKTEPVGASCARPRVIYYGVTVERYVVMPNHIHLLIMIDIEYGRAQLAPTVSHIVQQFKGIVTKRYGQSVWQKGFHDHVIRDYDDFLIRWQYIDENPKKWLMGKDEYYA